jgi:hypothetical protein
MRISKSETSSNNQGRKIQNSAKPATAFLSLGFWSFGFVSDLVLRASDLVSTGASEIPVFQISTRLISPSQNVLYPRLPCQQSEKGMVEVRPDLVDTFNEDQFLASGPRS